MAPFSSSLFFLLLLVSQASSSSSSNGGLDGCYIKSIYSFGDSIADTGNLIREGTGLSFAHIGSLPYGESFLKGPTGRCSNGLLMIDYIALALDLPLVNPYLNEYANFDHGVNFAVAGATALDNSFFVKRGLLMAHTNSSLSVQLDWFKTHLNSICSSPADCAGKLEHALFMVGEIGGNDYNFAFFEGKQIEEVMSYVPHVVQSIIIAIKEVIDAGAIQLVVPGNFPIGCFPCYLTTFRSSDQSAYDTNKCRKDLNSFAMLHNEQLQIAIGELRKAYPHVIIMYADYYNAFMHLLRNAVSLGFEESSLMKACCGSGGAYNYDATRICGNPGTSTCDDPAKYISWDGLHLTQETYKIMASELISGGFIYPSYGVQEKWKCPKLEEQLVESS